MKGFYILEGIDGAGKTTLSEEIIKKLDHSECLSTREPTNISPWGIRIREILGSRESIDPNDNDQLLQLFLEDRLWNLKKNVRPALEQGKAVIQDRYYFSTAAYQGKTPGKAIEILESYLERPDIVSPDCVFWIDIDPLIALQRMEDRSLEKEVYEKKEELERIRDNYRKIFRHPRMPCRIIIIDGTQSVKNISEQIIEVISSKQ